jgi:HEAT repeat protein
VIQDAFASPEARIREEVCGGLIAGGPQGRRYVSSLVKALEDAEARVAESAAVALAEIGDPAGLPALFEASRRPGLLAWFVLKSLSKLGKSDVRVVRGLLVRLVAEKDEKRRRYILEALGYHESEEGVKLLLPVLLTALKETHDPDTRSAILRGFRELGPRARAAVPGLAEFALAQKSWSRETAFALYELDKAAAESVWKEWQRKHAKSSTPVEVPQAGPQKAALERK